MSEKLKSLLEERANAWETTGKPLAERQEDWTADERTSWTNLETRLSELDKKIDQEERTLAQAKKDAEARDRIAGLGRPDPTRDDNDADDRGKPLRAQKRYTKAFENYVRYGMGSIEPEERKLLQNGHQRLEGDEARALGTTTGAVGGYTIPQGFWPNLTVAMKAFGCMVPSELGVDVDGDMNGDAPDGQQQAGVSLIETETGNPLPFPTENDTTNTGARLAENTVLGSQDIAFGQAMLNAWIYTSKLILCPWTLLQDSYFDVENFIATAAGKRLGRILNTEFTNGTGSGASMPMGVVTAAVVGKTLGSAAATPTYNDLIDLQHSVNRAYRPNAKFMFNDLSLAVIRKLTDAQNRPLWEPSLQNGAPSLFAGKPYVVNDDMTVVGSTGTKNVLYGDFSTYKARVVKSAALVRLEERYADALQTGFFVWCRADGNQIDGGGQAIKAIANP